MKNTLLAVGTIALLMSSGCNNNKAGGSGPSASGSTTSASTGANAGIKLGQTGAYSGPASAYGVISKVDVAYFKMVNDKGGINGHPVELLSYDDGYNAAKTVEQTRKLVEQDNILADFNGVGTAPQSSVHAYLNEHKVPQIFVASGADKWADPKFPWTIGYQPSYQQEARVFAKYIRDSKPNAKVCVLSQNDDFGKDYQAGLKKEFGDQHDKFIIKISSYEVTDPTIDSQIVSLQGSGCDTIVIAATPKFAAQAIRKIYDIGWKPTELVSSVSSSVTAVLKVAGLDKSTGVIVGAYLKDNSDPKLKDDAGLIAFREMLKKYAPDVDANDWNALYGYTASYLMTKTLEACGNDFSRENLMKVALHLKDVKLPTALDGITANTSPERPRPMSQLQLQKFNGTSYELFGSIVSAE